MRKCHREGEDGIKVGHDDQVDEVDAVAEPRQRNPSVPRQNTVNGSGGPLGAGQDDPAKTDAPGKAMQASVGNSCS